MPTPLAPVAGTGTTGTSTATVTPCTAMPSHQAGDLLIAHFDATANPTVSTAASGWTVLRPVLVSGTTSGISQFLYYRVAQSSTEAIPTFTLSKTATWTGNVTRWRNVDVVQNIGVPNSSATATSGTSLSFGALAALDQPNCMLVCTVGELAGTNNTITPGTGLTQIYNVQNSTTIQSWMGYHNLVGPGALTAASATASASVRHVDQSFVLRSTEYATYRATGNIGTGTTLQTVPALPAGQAQNDLLMLQVYLEPATATLATPTGWTYLGDLAGSTGHLYVFHKLSAGVSESAPTIAPTGSTIIRAIIDAYYRANTATPTDAVTFTDNGSATLVGTGATAFTAANVTAYGLFSVSSTTTGLGTPDSTDYERHDTTGEISEDRVVVSAGASGTSTTTLSSAAQTLGALVGIRSVTSGVFTAESGSAAAQASANAALIVSLVGAVTVQPVASGDGIQTLVALAGSTAGTAVATGTPSVQTLVALSGSAAGTAVAAGTPSVSIAESGTVAVQAAANAGLSILLTGAVTPQTVASVQLRVALSGSAAASALATSAMSVAERATAATQAGAAATPGILLTSAATGQPMASGQLRVALSGSAAGMAQAAGALSVAGGQPTTATLTVPSTAPNDMVVAMMGASTAYQSTSNDPAWSLNVDNLTAGDNAAMTYQPVTDVSTSMTDQLTGPSWFGMLGLELLAVQSPGLTVGLNGPVPTQASTSAALSVALSGAVTAAPAVAASLAGAQSLVASTGGAPVMSATPSIGLTAAASEAPAASTVLHSATVLSGAATGTASLGAAMSIRLTGGAASSIVTAAPLVVKLTAASAAQSTTTTALALAIGLAGVAQSQSAASSALTLALRANVALSPVSTGSLPGAQALVAFTGGAPALSATPNLGLTVASRPGPTATAGLLLGLAAAAAPRAQATNALTLHLSANALTSATSTGGLALGMTGSITGAGNSSGAPQILFNIELVATAGASMSAGAGLQLDLQGQASGGAAALVTVIGGIWTGNAIGHGGSSGVLLITWFIIGQTGGQPTIRLNLAAAWVVPAVVVRATPRPMVVLATARPFTVHASTRPMVVLGAIRTFIVRAAKRPFTVRAEDT